MELEILSCDSLLTIVKFLKRGDVIILYNNRKLLTYHMNDLDFNNEIYINVSSYPSLLDEGEWPYYIESIGASLINDNYICNGNMQHYQIII